MSLPNFPAYARGYHDNFPRRLFDIFPVHENVRSSWYVGSTVKFKEESKRRVDRFEVSKASYEKNANIIVRLFNYF